MVAWICIIGVRLFTYCIVLYRSWEAFLVGSRYGRRPKPAQPLTLPLTPTRSQNGPKRATKLARNKRGCAVLASSETKI